MSSGVYPWCSHCVALSAPSVEALGGCLSAGLVKLPTVHTHMLLLKLGWQHVGHLQHTHTHVIVGTLVLLP